MAGLMFNAEVSVTPDKAPETLIQLEAAANHGIVIHAIHLYGRGTVPASANDFFNLAIQTDAGSASSLTLNKMVASHPDSILSSGQQSFQSTEPTTGINLWQGAMHEQGTLIFVFPPEHRIFIAGGTRMGLICNMTGYFAVEAYMLCEE
jgi:hypothetical protein